MRGKFWLTPQAGGTHGLVKDILRDNEGPSSLRGSLVAMIKIPPKDSALEIALHYFCTLWIYPQPEYRQLRISWVTRGLNQHGLTLTFIIGHSVPICMSEGQDKALGSASRSLMADCMACSTLRREPSCHTNGSCVYFSSCFWNSNDLLLQSKKAMKEISYWQKFIIDLGLSLGPP